MISPDGPEPDDPSGASSLPPPQAARVTASTAAEISRVLSLRSIFDSNQFEVLLKEAKRSNTYKGRLVETMAIAILDL